jgi:cell division protein FtsI (penicillin-binding protein 3)
MTLKDALFILENKGLRVNHTGRGRVISQSQSAGAVSLRGSTVYLMLGSGS